jgi:hypothetical protein
LWFSFPPFLENLTGNAQWREPPAEVEADISAQESSSHFMGKFFFFAVIVGGVAWYLRASKLRQSREGGILGA